MRVYEWDVYLIYAAHKHICVFYKKNKENNENVANNQAGAS